MYRTDSWLEPSQWEMPLQSNGISHWLGANLESALCVPLSGTGPRFNIKMTSYWYRKSHCGHKTILRPSYLHNGISYTGKTTSLYWIRALNLITHCGCVPVWPVSRRHLSSIDQLIGSITIRKCFLICVMHLGPLLHRLTEVGAWMSNYIHDFLWDANTHPYPDFKGNFD